MKLSFNITFRHIYMCISELVGRFFGIKPENRPLNWPSLSLMGIFKWRPFHFTLEIFLLIYFCSAAKWLTALEGCSISINVNTPICSIFANGSSVEMRFLTRIHGIIDKIHREGTVYNVGVVQVPHNLPWITLCMYHCRQSIVTLTNPPWTHYISPSPSVI